jgi:pimeloyl-ACP methyl ester carboxylesterase
MKGWLARRIDILMGHALSSLVNRPGGRHTTDLAALEEYRKEPYLSAPERLYESHGAPESILFGEPRVSRTFICEPFTFPSLYRPISAAFAQRYAAYSESHTVCGRRYRPFMGESRATILFLHGWTGGTYRWEEPTLISWLCQDCGFTVLALVHPYHGQRTPAQARFSGEFFISSDAVRMIEACRQAAIDARTALTWLLDDGTQPVGVAGISLGAYITYLILAADDRPSFAIPMLGHGDLIDGPGDSALAKNVKKGYRAQGLSPRTLLPLTRSLTAREMQPRLAPERIMPINGLYDAISTADKAQRLFEAWGIPDAVWLESGHFGILHTRQFRKRFRAFAERWI